MRISAALPSGVTALFFEAAAARRELERRLVPVLEDAGWSEALLPILDYAEPYEPLLTSRRRGELYRFVDRGGELLALRADFTPLLARLLAPQLAAVAGGVQAPPLRLYYRGDVVRYGAERPGRMRELYQLGGERIGGDGAQGERDTLTTFLELLAASGCGAVRVVMGCAGALDELLLAPGGDPLKLAAAVERRERGTARAASSALAAIVEQGVPQSDGELGGGAGALQRLRSLEGELSGRFPGIALDVDLAEFATHVVDPALRARSLDASYYDGLMFRAYVGSDTVAVGSGGRYDGLFGALGCDVTASGFTLGVDRLAEEAGTVHASKAREREVLA